MELSAYFLSLVRGSVKEPSSIVFQSLIAQGRPVSPRAILAQFREGRIAQEPQ